MDPLSFSLAYIALAYLVVACVWVTTTPIHRLVSLQLSWSTRGLLVFVNLLHFVSGILFPIPLPLDVPIRSFGLTILTVGLVLAVWAKLTMKQNWGVPGVHEIANQKYLVKDGPFSYTRNPIYVGLILMSFGMAVALKSVFIFLIFVLYNYFYRHILEEEKLLVKHFGKEYLEFSTDVPRFM